MDKKFNFSKGSIDKLDLPEHGKRLRFYDTKMRGLSLKVTANGTKTFILYRKVNGRPEEITLGRYPDLSVEQARGLAAEANAAFAKGENPADKKRQARAQMTLNDLFSQYVDHHLKLNKSARTLINDQSFFRYLADKEIGTNLAAKKLSSISRNDLAALHFKISKSYPITANRVIGLVSRLFNWATRNGLWDKANPAQHISMNREKSRDRFLQADELPRFFQALSEEPNDTLRDFFLISLLTGARRANVQAMEWSQISFERAEWRIPATKNGTPQTVTLSEQALTILANRKPAGVEKYVFPGPGRTGHLIEPKSGWRRILDRADITDLRLHDLRRTLGSWQAKTGASLAIIGKSLNHKSVSSTAIYARLDQDPVRESIERATSAMLSHGGLLPKAEVTDIKKAKEQK